MTQIVYDGRHLLADRKCTYGYYTPIDAPKVFKLQVGDITRYFAFSGSFKECALGEEVVRSNFDPEVRSKVRSILGEDVLEHFLGIVVDVSPVGKRVCLINYAGDFCEINPDQFIAIGAMHSELSAAWKVWTRVYVKDDNVVSQVHNLTTFVRVVTEGTAFDQTGRTFDIYDTETGELR
jgi:hypothetical protein